MKLKKDDFNRFEINKGFLLFILNVYNINFQ